MSKLDDVREGAEQLDALGLHCHAEELVELAAEYEKLEARVAELEDEDSEREEEVEEEMREHRRHAEHRANVAERDARDSVRRAEEDLEYERASRQQERVFGR